MFIKDIMKKDVLTLGKNASVKDTLELMTENHAGSVVIVEGSKIAGIVTEGDILSKIVNENRGLETTIDKIMTKSVITISPAEKIEKAAELMTESKIKKLPVMNKNKLVGIVTITDIVASGVNLENEILEELSKWFPVKKKTCMAG
jgi:CBS domain-containing protein